MRARSAYSAWLTGFSRKGSMRWDKTNVKKAVYIIIGAFIYAIGINAFLVPQRFLTGGFAGIAMLLYYLVKWPVGVTVFIMNIPLFVLSFKYISGRFVMFSLVGMIALSACLSLTEGWAMHLEDPLLASLFGGAIAGLGTGIVLRQRGSLGGTDIISVLINKYFSFDIGTITAILNGIILGVALIASDITVVLYSAASIFVSSQVIDGVQAGLNRRKTAFIVTDHPDEIAARIIEKMHRGVTFLHGEGAYTHQQKKIIYCDVTTMEVARLKEIVKKMDDQAFMTIMDAREVLGQGFSLEDSF